LYERRVMLGGRLETLLHNVNVRFRCGDALPGLLLKSVQNVNHLSEPYGVHGAVRVAVVVFDDLDNACVTKASERLGAIMLASGLRHVKGVADCVTHLFRKAPEIASGAPDPVNLFLLALITHRPLCHIWHIDTKRQAGISKRCEGMTVT